MDSSDGFESFESFDLMLSIDVVTVTTVPVLIGVCRETVSAPGRFKTGFSKSDEGASWAQPYS